MGKKLIKALLGIVIVFVMAMLGRQMMSEVGMSFFASVPPDKKFMLAWENDIKRLDRAKALHPGFKDLRDVEFIATSEKLKLMLKKYPINFKTNPDGHFRLEIFLDELTEGGLMMQYDLVELKSGNTVWERGRTFPQKL